MKKIAKTTQLFTWIFLSTGVFAILGALYTWGEGPLFSEDDLLTALVPWADLLLTGPLSIFTAYGIKQNKSWGFYLGLMVCGIYLFGSLLVYISLAWHGAPYPPQLSLPPLSGIAIGIAFPIWVLRKQQLLLLPANSQPARNEGIPTQMEKAWGSKI